LKGFNGTSCADINECASAFNGGCNLNFTCANTFGSFTCGASSCGDNICNTNEDCVNCSPDCGYNSCGMCGDGVCDKATESCENCFEDCGSCDPCAGVDSNLGVCSNGVCKCPNGNYGLSCNDAVSTNVTVAPTNPIVNITPTTTQQDQSGFSVAITNIEEVDNKNVVLRSLNVSAMSFILTNYTSDNYTFWSYEANTFANLIKPNTIKNLNSEDPTYLQIRIYDFHQLSNINFANNNLVFPQDSVKVFTTISYWPFLSIVNHLRLTITLATPSAEVPPPGCTQQTTTSNNNYNTKWVKVSGSGYSLYATTYSLAEIDSRIVNVVFSQDSNNILVDVPHFWNNATVDPDFSVLLEGAPAFSCSPQESNVWRIPVAVSVVVVAVVVGSVMAYFFIKRKKQWKRQLTEIELKGRSTILSTRSTITTSLSASLNTSSTSLVNSDSNL